MLDSNNFGYAIMGKDLNSYSFEDESLEVCKRYCRGTDVIVEQIPYVTGFTITIEWLKFYKPFRFKYYPKNILWVHWVYRRAYSHKNGKIVFNNF